MSPRRVWVGRSVLRDFCAAWPCSGLRGYDRLWIDFDATGRLEATGADDDEDVDQQAVSVLAESVYARIGEAEPFMVKP